MEDENPPRKKITHEIGQDLSLLSVGELGERIAMLREEIARLEAASEAKRLSKSVAEDVFKR
jgi:uncharacterized small protein (DUF1192 family)